ncbi:hypothetical protein FDB23_16475 [Clostridium botulinum]|nr:hypothetical protein [Clostridium botulinum]
MPNNQYQMKGAQYITEENKGLIGTETIYSKNNSYLKSTNEQYTLESNHIIKDIDAEMALDSAPISEFIVKKENDKYITPEIIGANGSISVFTKEDGSGWTLNKGEELTINFNKYKSKIVKDQNIIIGYVLNGKMIKGKTFSDLLGSYKLTADESGEYYIYIVNSSSDYVAFKEGSIEK